MNVSTSQAPEPVEKIDPTANLGEWLEKDLQSIRGETPVAKSEDLTPATPMPEPPQPPATSWRDVVFGDDVENKFFKGKPVPEVLKSYNELRTHHDTYKGNTEKELRELRRERDELRARQVADTAIREYVQQNEQRQTQEDPRLVRAQEVWHDNPAEAMRLITAVNDERAQQIAQANLAKLREDMSAETQQDRVRMAGTQAYDAAVVRLAKDYGLDEATARMRANFLIPVITEQDPSPIFSADNYIAAAGQIFGAPKAAAPSTTPVVVPVPATPATPPGAAKPSPAVNVAETRAPLDEERMESLRLLSDDPKVIAKFVEKMKRK
jgi:hypothetical protein